MSDEIHDQGRDPAIARRRRVLYAVALVALVGIAVFALGPLSGEKKKTSKQAKVVTPVILARIELKPVGGSSASGLAEVLRRGSGQSLRVLATKLTPNKKDEAYQLVLAGGAAPERLLGTAIVGAERLFVGEAKIGIDELERHRTIQLRRVTRGPDATAETVLRGRIPR